MNEPHLIANQPDNQRLQDFGLSPIEDNRTPSTLAKLYIQHFRFIGEAFSLEFTPPGAVRL